MFQTEPVEKIETHILCSITNFSFENSALYDILWKNIVEPVRPQMTLRCIVISCWIPQATNTHSEYVILIAFQLQKWLQESARMLRYTYSLVKIKYFINFYIIYIHPFISIQP